MNLKVGQEWQASFDAFMARFGCFFKRVESREGALKKSHLPLPFWLLLSSAEGGNSRIDQPGGHGVLDDYQKLETINI